MNTLDDHEEQLGNIDGWGGERIEFIVPNKSGMDYHFNIPLPLYNYITDILKMVLERSK